jgi:hypothetical protein
VGHDLSDWSLLAADKFHPTTDPAAGAEQYPVGRKSAAALLRQLRTIPEPGGEIWCLRTEKHLTGAGFRRRETSLPAFLTLVYCERDKN